MYTFYEGRGSVGVVIRYEKGNFIACRNKSLPFVANAMMEEAFASREGLCLA
jgi:hypothetical protein